MVKTKKIPKDPNAPKMPNRPFIFFSMEVNKEVKEELSKEPSVLGGEANFQLQGKIATVEIAKACGIKWNALSETEKEKYNVLYKEDTKRYQEEMKSYTPSAEYLEKVEKAKLENSRNTNNNPDLSTAKVPHMVRAYFDYLTTTWFRVAASNRRLNPQQVQEEIWRRWSRGESGGGGASCNDWDENRNLKKPPRKRMRPPPASSKSSTPTPPLKPAFQYFLEQMKGELRKHLPDLPDSEVVKHVSAKWKVMTDVEKEPFFVLEKEGKEKHEDQLKKAKLEDESKDVTIKGETAVLSSFDQTNDGIWGGGKDVDAQKIENSKRKSFLKENDVLDVQTSTHSAENVHMHCQEDGSNVNAAVQKGKDDDDESNMKAENTSSSSSDSSEDDSESTTSDSESDSAK